LLTDRQAAVLRRLCAGGSAGEVARELGITEEAVRTHLHLIRRRLGAAALPELCRRGGPDVAAAERRAIEPTGQHPAGDSG
jgi:DNA-binding CsgD family transcriptional regulator